MSDGIQLPFYQVDAFTDRPFSGNPAAVCLLADPLPTGTMRAVAAEMNLSETAFVQLRSRDGLRKLQWFTPKVEVPLCGHATLATAHTLLREEGVDAPLRFDTRSGTLAVEEEEDGWLRMDFPVDRPVPAPPPEGLLEVLGCPPSTPTLLGVKGWVVRLPSKEDVRRMSPDFTRLGRVDVGATALGVIVTALTPYWAGETGRGELRAQQISARGGTLRVSIEGDRVQVSGQAVTVVRGSLFLP
jgi:PhzF family phenazine biosynthesis protein